MLDELLASHDQDPPQESSQSQDPPQEPLQPQDPPQESPQDPPQDVLLASVPSSPAEGTSDDEPTCSYWPAHSADVTIPEQVLYFFNLIPLSSSLLNHLHAIFVVRDS